jgi:hypothetical protein
VLVLFRQMSKAEFQLAFDGPALRAGTMEVGELAASLLAVGDLIRDANQQLNEDRAEVSVRVKADFKSGSFDIALLLDQSLLEQAKNLLLPGAVIGGAGLLRLLFGSEVGKKGVSGIVTSVLDIWKKLKGEKPKDAIEDKGKGITVLVSGTGNQVNVGSSHAVSLYGRDSIRSAIAGVVRPVAKQGINSLDIRKGKRSINQVHKTDLPSPQEADLSTMEDSTKVRRDTREAVLRVARANFEKGKWGFSDGAANFSADITDQVFRQQLDAREIGFFKGDTLRVILAITQTISSEGNAFHTVYEIEKVLGHTHAPKQESFPPGQRLIE